MTSVVGGRCLDDRAPEAPFIQAKMKANVISFYVIYLFVPNKKEMPTYTKSNTVDIVKIRLFCSF